MLRGGRRAYGGGVRGFAGCFLKVWGFLALAMSSVFLVVMVGGGLPRFGLPFVLIPLLFFGLGLTFLFGRKGVVFDTELGTVTRWWGLLVPFKRTSAPLETVDRVVVEGRDMQVGAIQAGAYRVHAHGEGKPYDLGKHGSSADAWRVAADLARLIQVPVENRCTDPPQVVQPADLGPPDPGTEWQPQQPEPARPGGAPDPERYERSRNLGCARVMGLPFAGIGLTFAVMPWVAMVDGDTPGFVFLFLAAFSLFGLLFAAIGLGLMFGRAGVIIDRRAGLVTTWMGLGPLMRRRASPLERYRHVKTETVVSRSSEGGSTTSHNVSLEGPGATLHVGQGNTPEQARALATEVAEFLGFEIQDEL